MVRIDVMGISLDAETRSPLLLLRQHGANVVIPLWIGAMEALSISFALGKIPMPRPLSHDLMANLLQALQATLSSVRILRVHQETFMAEMDILSATKGTATIDARPSDAIALALRADAPIFASKEVIQRAGRAFTSEQLQHWRHALPGDLALLFSSPQSPSSEKSSSDNIFAEVRALLRAARQEKLNKTAAESQPQTCQNTFSVDLSNQETLGKLLRVLAPETKYKM